MKRKPKPGLPRLFDRPKYRQRNIIERIFGWLKENRRIVTRFDKLAISYAAMVSLAGSMRCLRHLFSYRAWRTESFLFQAAKAFGGLEGWAYKQHLTVLTERRGIARVIQVGDRMDSI